MTIVYYISIRVCIFYTKELFPVELEWKCGVCALWSDYFSCIHQQASTVAKCMAGNQVSIHVQQGLGFAGSEHLGCCCCTLRLYFPLSPAISKAQSYYVMSCFHLSPFTQQHRVRHLRTLLMCFYCCVINKWDSMACSRNTHCCNCVHMVSLAACHVRSACV